ncbi:MAG: hypothetical protein ABF254_00950 [Octadecabacter sp.]
MTPAVFIKKSLIVAVLLALSACASPTIDCPREGGIGGTGGCTTNEPLR